MNTKRTQLHTTTYPKLHRGEVPLGRFLYEENILSDLSWFELLSSNVLSRLNAGNFNVVLILCFRRYGRGKISRGHVW